MIFSIWVLKIMLIFSLEETFCCLEETFCCFYTTQGEQVINLNTDENWCCIIKKYYHIKNNFIFFLRIEWGPSAWIRFQLWVPSLVENGARLSRCGCNFIHLSPTQSTEKSRHRSESTHKLTRYNIGWIKKGRCWY